MTERPRPVLVPQPHGGALSRGGFPGNPGGGRPPDAIRAKLRELGLKGAVPVLKGVLDGTLTVPMVGQCPKCGEERPLDATQTATIASQLQKMTDQQLKAADLTLKYGLSARELVIASPDAAAFFDLAYTAAVEMFGAEPADTWKARVIQLAAARK